METETNLESERQRRRDAAWLAIEKVRAMSLPTEIGLAKELSGIGRRADVLFEVLKDDLSARFGALLPQIMSVALHEYWLECWRCALYIQAGIDDKLMNDNEFTRRMTTARGYADAEGWAYTLANGFADLEPSEPRIEGIRALTGHEILDSSTALTCMAVYWLQAATIEMNKGRHEYAFDIIFEAYDALSLDGEKTMWDAGWASAIESEGEKLKSTARSELARKAGHAAHVENYALKAEVREYWKSNISPSLSNDAAATILLRQFPLKFRTLSKYVSEFKNTLG